MQENVLQTEYTKEQFIDLLNNGVCPFCKKGGWKKVLVHVCYKHGVTADIIKNELLVPLIKGFCDEETRQKAIDNVLTVQPWKTKPITRGHERNEYAKKKMSIKASVRCNDPIYKRAQSKRSSKQMREFIANNPEKAKKMYKRINDHRRKLFFGTEKGYSDLYYAQVANFFAKEAINKNDPYTYFAQKMEISISSFYKKIEVAKKRGLIRVTGKGKNIRCELTDKTLDLLKEAK